jgi:DNA-binding CsgD family transcriptional regulator
MPSEFDLLWLKGEFNLTQRELDVLRLVAEARSSKQIAAELGLCKPTVEVHRAHLRHKLGVRNTAGILHIVLSGPRTPFDAADGLPREGVKGAASYPWSPKGSGGDHDDRDA